MCSGKGDWALPQPGFPIRTSPDHSSVGSSPRLFAASYVLHRFLMPRHPPCALNNLPQIPLVFLMTKSLKMLASTMQFSTFGRVPLLVRRLPVAAVADGWFDVRMAQPDESGPRRRTRSLRTQQCVWRTLVTALLFHSGEPAVLRIASTQARPCQRSTLELSPAEHSSTAGSRQLSVPRCSLERR